MSTSRLTEIIELSSIRQVVPGAQVAGAPLAIGDTAATSTGTTGAEGVFYIYATTPFCLHVSQGTAVAATQTDPVFPASTPLWLQAPPNSYVSVIQPPGGSTGSAYVNKVTTPR